MAMIDEQRAMQLVLDFQTEKGLDKMLTLYPIIDLATCAGLLTDPQGRFDTIAQRQWGDDAFRNVAKRTLRLHNSDEYVLDEECLSLVREVLAVLEEKA